MLEVKNLSYSVKEGEQERKILDNLSLVFPKNKITVITGQNGSGKSTLIKLLMGILPASGGEIFYNNQDITKMSIAERANLGFSIAFQQPVRFKGLTVRDLLSLASKNNTSVSDACQFLAQVGLCARDYLDREVDGTLSGGELKRIELALTLAKGGEVFLFDEPEAGIDLWAFDNLIEVFKSLKNKTVIIVSHQKKILECADFIVLLNPNSSAKVSRREDMIEDLVMPVCHKLGGAND